MSENLSRVEGFDPLQYMKDLEKRDNTSYSKALQELYPGTQWAVSGTNYETLEWAAWNTQPKPTKQELDDKVAELEQRWVDTQYQRDRAAAYPSIEQQLDALYHQGYDGWKALISGVKEQFPKE
jgi:hypothetical protein